MRVIIVAVLCRGETVDGTIPPLYVFLPPDSYRD
jgi:hypothetical protein